MGTIVLLFTVTGLLATTWQKHTVNQSRYRLAILTTPDNGPETFLHIVEVGLPFPPPTAKFRHLPDAAVRGVVLPDGAVLAIADYEPGRDRSFGSALFRLEPGAEPTLVCDRVVFASRPLITPEGRVFIQRGAAGPATQGGETRVDSLSIEEVDLSTGDTKVIWQSTGYIAYTAAAFQGDIVLYHIRPEGARVILVNMETGAEKVVLPSLPPFASDFSITDTGDLVFQNRDEKRTDLWIVESLRLTSGERQRFPGDQASLAPRAWPHGEVTWNTQKGLHTTISPLSIKPLQGLIDIRAFSPDGAVAAAYVFPLDSSAPDIILVDSTGAQKTRIATPPRTPLTVAGFVP